MVLAQSRRAVACCPTAGARRRPTKTCQSNVFAVWGGALSTLRKLTLVDASLEDEIIFPGISQLDMLFITESRKLKNYEFLKDMAINRLYIEKTEDTDLSVLYELKNVGKLVLQEHLLANINMKLLDPFSVKRWIDTPRNDSEFPLTYRLPHFLVKE